MGIAVTAASTTIHACRICGGTELAEVLDLGTVPLANALLAREELKQVEPRFPLRVVFCPRCTLVQITETVAPELLFRNYNYFSSFSDELVEHSRRHTEALIADRQLGANSLVVEVASNDGYLLQHFVRAGVPVLGIEPAVNIAAVANERGVRTITEFFGADTAARLRADGLRADVVLGNNVLAHVADLNGFVSGAAQLLADDGIVELEFPYVADLVDRTEFDTIYHEHLCYFSAHAIDRLFRNHDLVFTDVQRLELHGGSLRVTGSRRANDAGRSRVGALLEQERRRGLTEVDYYRAVAPKVEALGRDLVALLERLKRDGKRIVGYGASAKGSTLLNHFGIGDTLLDYLVDRSTVKQGRFAPGVHLEIVAPERLVVDRPDYALLLTWNFAAEIQRQQASYVAAGGRFIVPVPEVEVLAP